MELGRKQEVVVYDQSSKEAGHLSKDGFVHILMGKLEGTFHKVSLLTGKSVMMEFFFFWLCLAIFLAHFYIYCPSYIEQQAGLPFLFSLVISLI